MCDFLAVDGIELPQLSTSFVGERVEIPKVSPGQTEVSPNSGEIRAGADCQPCAIEKVRR